MKTNLNISKNVTVKNEITFIEGKRRLNLRLLKTRFERLLRLRELEFFQVILHDEERYAFLLYFDEECAGSKVDLEAIKIYLISNFELSAQSYEDVLSFNNDMFGMKPCRGYFMEEVKVEEEFDFDFPNDMDAVRRYAQYVLELTGNKKDLGQLENERFNYLTQN